MKAIPTIHRTLAPRLSVLVTALLLAGCSMIPT